MDHTTAAQLIQTMVTFRKKIPSIINEVNNKITKQQLEYLDRIKINLNKPEINCDIPEDIFEKLKTNQNDYAFNRNLFEQLQLVEIMKSKKSSISKIIDAI
ncbi:uncharacterized protein LOC130894067 [Diorhabda carinulata]|uniref:uncharacterized protein LOC130446270 n=1 Tax=Diorhabda sublineata TaxID=1163346 RepID=UPI0024E067A6|nr:uncharacterized protein LOC130446270 [Diorhabda sublineata]XP_057656610.1 uncharacterized protein LOC130894067 [Diorhabda carinulata]